VLTVQYKQNLYVPFRSVIVFEGLNTHSSYPAPCRSSSDTPHFTGWLSNITVLITVDIAKKNSFPLWYFSVWKTKNFHSVTSLAHAECREPTEMSPWKGITSCKWQGKCLSTNLQEVFSAASPQSHTFSCSLSKMHLETWGLLQLHESSHHSIQKFCHKMKRLSSECTLSMED